MRKSNTSQLLELYLTLGICSEEQDEETIEWEQEQLRRGGHTAEDTQPSAQKVVYKPAPSTSHSPQLVTATLLIVVQFLLQPRSQLLVLLLPGSLNPSPTLLPHTLNTPLPWDLSGPNKSNLSNANKNYALWSP